MPNWCFACHCVGWCLLIHAAAAYDVRAIVLPFLRANGYFSTWNPTSILIRWCTFWYLNWPTTPKPQTNLTGDGIHFQSEQSNFFWPVSCALSNKGMVWFQSNRLSFAIGNRETFVMTSNQTTNLKPEVKWGWFELSHTVHQNKLRGHKKWKIKLILLI